jgi:RND family efflux transporter MFP subunit
MLVTAGTAGQTSLFSVVQQNRLRVQVSVPQAQAAQIRLGQTATVVVPERPGQSFAGVVKRTAASVDSRSRTLNVEIELPNEDHTLLPGAYAEVKLEASGAENNLRVPASTLLLKSSGTFVAAVDRDSLVRVIPVQLGRDHGASVEVASGLRGDESLVVNPTDELSNGERVTLTRVGAG